MSYDLDLFCIPEGYSLNDVFDALEDGTLPISNDSKDVKLQRNLAIAKALLAKNAGLTIYPQNATELDQINIPQQLELHSEDGITIYLYPDQASVSVTYLYRGPDVERIFMDIREYLQIIQAHTDYAICDPQLGKIIYPMTDFNAMMDAYLSI